MRNPYPLGTMDAVEFAQDMADDCRQRDVQRELDDARDALRAYDERSKKADAPIPQACTFCDNVFAGAVCNLCKEERPAYTALKAATKKQEAA